VGYLHNKTMQGANHCSGKTDTDKPLVTFTLIAYNHEKFVRQAMESALAQTYRPIQFIFSDDCSTDRTFEIMREVAAQHEEESILLNQNDQNLGVVDHLNKVFIDLAEGKYIVPLAGDDIATPDRTEKVVACFEDTGASAVASNPVMIDEDCKMSGNRLYSIFPVGVLHFEEYFVKGARFFGGGGYERKIFDIYGPMKNNVRNEDRILPFRASTLGGIAYLDDTVHLYREHGKNMSFWVKMKRDPDNSLLYQTEFKKNDLQNLANFMQEVKESYQGQDKAYMLKQINARYNHVRFEIALLKAGIFPQLELVPAAFRIGGRSRETLRLLMICLSPKLYRLMHSVVQSLR